MVKEEKILEMRSIRKTFPGNVIANDDVDLAIAEGEIHGLLGENGAGKSTLMKILYGLYSADSGDICLHGVPQDFTSPRDAIDAGIGMVHQHFMLIPRMSVLQNCVLGRQENPLESPRSGRITDRFERLVQNETVRDIAGLLSIDLANSKAKLNAISDDLGMDIDVEAKVSTLTVGEQQRIEILKALYWDADILVLDEPTAVLSPTETVQLFRTLERLVDNGLSIIIITHKLNELTSITDRISVLRDGKMIDTVETADISERDLAEMMVGREVSFDVVKDETTSGRRAISASSLHAKDDHGFTALSGVDIVINEAEIVGVAGVSGNGQIELAECLAGVREPQSGDIIVQDHDILKTPSDFIEAGVSYIPEDRLKYGCAPELTVMENLIIKDRQEFTNSRGVLNFDEARAHTEQMIQEYNIRVPNTEVSAENLSGGNLQKLIIAREIHREPTALIACQPTRGVDVGAIEYIQDVLLEQREQGTGILLISEELDEVIQMSDRIVVLYNGEIVHRTSADEADREKISRLMTSGTAEESDSESVGVAS